MAQRADLVGNWRNKHDIYSGQGIHIQRSQWVTQHSPWLLAGPEPKQPLTVCRLAFDKKSQWNRFEDLETLQSKKRRLLVSLQSGHQKKKLRCTFQVETTLGNQYAL